MTFSESRWKWIALGAVLWYSLFGTLCILNRPGLHYDEAIDVRGPVHMRHSRTEMALTHAPGTWICIMGRCLPLMSARYIGAVKEYLSLPLFAVFGTGAEVVRGLAMVLAAIGIAGVSALVAQQAGPAAGAAAAWVLAISPSYLDQTVFDNAALTPWMAAFGLLCVSIRGYLKHPGWRGALLIGTACGFGVWARANYVWLLASVALGVALAARRKALLPWRHLAAIAAGGILGGLPFLIYQWNSRGGTWSTFELIATQETLAYRSMIRLVNLSEVLLTDREHRMMIWGGPPEPAWQFWFFPIVAAIACVICLFWANGVWPRAAAATALILTGLFLESSLPVSEHHLMALLPIVVSVVVTAGTLVKGRLRVLVGLVGLVYAGSALYWQFAILGGLRRTGGVGAWSDGIYELTNRLETQYPKVEARILDWGLQAGIFVLSDARVASIELFWGASQTMSGLGTKWSDEIDRGGVFVLNGPQNRQVPEASTGFLKALGTALPVYKRQAILQRDGSIYAEILEIEPRTSGKGRHQPAGASRVDANEESTSQLSGVYGVEQGAWRWTEKEFGVILTPSSATLPGKLFLRINVPQVCLDKLGPLTLQAQLDGKPLAHKTLPHSGDYTLTWDLAPGQLQAGPNRFAFRLDKWLPASAHGRELGIIFVSATLEPR